MKLSSSLRVILGLLSLSLVCQAEDDFDKEDISSAEHLLQKIVPLGSMPSMPDGFPSLSELKTDKFEYSTNKGKVTVTADLEDPVSLLGQAMTLNDVKMTFKYDKNRPEGKWQFNAEGKWKQGNMTAKVKIEESKIGDHHTMVAAADRLNVYDVASELSEKKSVEHAGMNVDTLKELFLTDVEMYSVFKGNDDYVFMISGDPLLSDTHSTDCKVFIHKTPGKKSVFSVLLEFKHDLPSRALIKLVSDDLFKIPFINHLIAKTRVFRKSRTNFGFVASTGDVDKLPLKSFGDGILADELQAHISKGLTLLLPFRLGSEERKPVKVAVVVNPPLVKFITSRHEQVSVEQTLKALSPSSRIRVLPNGFPDLSSVNIDHFSYNIHQETFTVHAKLSDTVAVIPGLLNVSETDVTFRHRVGDEFNTWSFEGHGVSELGGAKANITLKTEEETKVVFITGKAEKMSVKLLAQQYGLSFIPDAESDAIVQNSQMSDFDFIQPKIKSATSDKQKNRYIHISGLGNFPGVDKATEAEAVVYEDKGKLKTSVGFIFPKIPMPFIIEALTGYDVDKLKKLLRNSFNTSLVLSLDDDDSLFENPTLSGLSFERGISMVGLFRMPGECRHDKMCKAAKSMLESDQWYRIQGLVKRDGFNLAGMVNRNYVLGNGLVLRDNMLQLTINDDSSFNVQSKLTFPKEQLSFAGNINFDNGSVELSMKSEDAIYRSHNGGYLTFDQLSLNTEIMNSVPLQKLPLTGRMTLGKSGSGHEITAPCSISYQAMQPDYSRVESKLSEVTMYHVAEAMGINATLPFPLAYAPFVGGLEVIYDPAMKSKTNLTMRGKLHIFDRHFDSAVEMNNSDHIHLTSSYTKSPFVLSDGFIVVQESKEISKSGPRLDVSIAPFDVKVKLVGFARVLGTGSPTEIKISDSGTEFPVQGNLFDISSTGLYVSSPEVLGNSEASSFQAYGCLPGIHDKVLSAVDTLIKAAATEADNFIHQATDNLKEAKNYYRKATKNEEYYRQKLDEEENILNERNREVWLAEQRYNSSCKLNQCTKSCIGCPDWNRCCTRDVFGSCVECPSWNKCCYKTGDPVCVASNHGCDHIRRVASGNLEDARDIYFDQKRRVNNVTQSVFDAEFSKGKTKAVLDAAGKALSLIDRDSTIGIEASKSIKHVGLENVLKIQSICFQAPVDSLATSCINMSVNASVMGSDEVKTLPFHACLNKELVPRMARFLANYLFPDIGSSKQKRSLINEEKNSLPESVRGEGKLTTFLRRRGLVRRTRDAETADERENIEPFWDLIQQHDPLKEVKKGAPPSHPSMGNLKRKWKIPATKTGKCKIYHQLLDICRDMMKTVKKMYGTYMYERYLFAKEKDHFTRKLKRVTKQLEISARQVSGTEDQMERIKRSLNFVSDGVQKWEKKCDEALKHQETISVKAWVKAMDSRITSLGGEGVERFLGNLFRAFDGLFESSSLPPKAAGKAVTIMQRVRQIKAAFNQIFMKYITLGRANYHADRVLYDIAEIANIKIYCHKKKK